MRGRRWAVIAALAGLLVVLAGAGVLVLAMIGGYGGCASRDTARDPGGAWRIAETNCGATVGFIWRVHVTGTDGTERLALETTPYPEAVRAELAGDVLRVWSSDPGEAWEVPLDAQRRPRRRLRLVEGRLQP
jgi:hypothetical protein